MEAKEQPRFRLISTGIAPYETHIAITPTEPLSRVSPLSPEGLRLNALGLGWLRETTYFFEKQSNLA